MIKPPKLFVEDHKSSTTDQDFSFLDKELSFLVRTEEEALKSFEKLLSKKKVMNTEEIEKEGFTPKDIAGIISKGKAVFRKLTKPAELEYIQLKLF